MIDSDIVVHTSKTPLQSQNATRFLPFGTKPPHFLPH